MKNCENFFVLGNSLKPGKYIVKYKVDRIAFTDLFFVSSADSGMQKDLLGRTVAALPEVEYKFAVEVEQEGDIALRAYAVEEGKTIDPKILYSNLERV